MINCFADESPRQIYKPFFFKRPRGTRWQSNVYSGEFVENGNNSPNTIIRGGNIGGDPRLVDDKQTALMTKLIEAQIALTEGDGVVGKQVMIIGCLLQRYSC